MEQPKEQCNFTIEQQWRFFLQRAGFKPGELGQLQESEMQKAFYAACGQMLFLFRDELSQLNEHEAIGNCKKMVSEIVEFWKLKQVEYDAQQQNKGTGTSPTS